MGEEVYLYFLFQSTPLAPQDLLSPPLSPAPGSPSWSSASDVFLAHTYSTIKVYLFLNKSLIHMCIIVEA